jgi:hypothetical protein
MTTLMQAHTQWASRPADERFTSLTDLMAHVQHQRDISRGTRVSSRKLRAEPILDDPTHKALAILGPDAAPAAPTHFSFGQLATLVKAPAAYLRTLPNAMVADCINYGLFRRDAEDVGALLRQNGALELAAVTGPNYGRIWNADVVRPLRDRFGDGVTGQFTVPGEFGKPWK